MAKQASTCIACGASPSHGALRERSMVMGQDKCEGCAEWCRNEGGGWDTPDVARMLLRGVMGRHRDHLDLLRAPSSDRSLAALALG